MSITLDELAAREHLSVRAYNVCRANGLTTLDALQDHLRRVGTFTKLRNAGRLTEQELVGICQKYESPEHAVAAAGEPSMPASIGAAEEPAIDWAGLSSDARAAVERHFAALMQTLSVRGRHLLEHIVPRIDRSPREFVEFFGQPANRYNHPNAGRVTIDEMLRVRREVLEHAAFVGQVSPERAVFAKVSKSWSDRFGMASSEVAEYRQDFIVRRFPLFRFLKNLFDRNQGLSERDLHLMRRRWNYILGEETKTLEELGTELGVTRERVRQVANGIPSRLRELVCSIGPVQDFVSYEAMLGRTRDLLVVDEEFADYINSREGTSFTAAFCSTVFEAFLRDSHDRIEEDFDASTDYLVLRELSEVFSFDDFLRDMAGRLEARIPETYLLDLADYVTASAADLTPTLVSRIAAVCEVLAREEFGIAADASGRLVFERNTKKTLPELIADLLDEAREPLHVEKITEQLNERHPGLDTNVQSVRGTLLRFERFARYDWSTYGLREWEQQYAHLKSGSFADIAEQFLTESEAPRHVNEVADYVLQYRSSNRYSVIGTLKADVSGRFRFYEGGMIGLRDRTYAAVNVGYRAIGARAVDALVRLVHDNGNAVELTRLIDYCALHHRIPASQSRALIEGAIAEGRLRSGADQMVSVGEGLAEEAAVEGEGRG